MFQKAETSYLLRQAVDEKSHLKSFQQFCKHVCLPSKAAILVLFWTVMVGAVYSFVLITTAVLIFSKSESSSISISINDSLPYAILALVSVFYPLSGLIADVCCGRLKTVAVSLCCILAFVLLLCIIETIVLTTGLTYYKFSFHNFEGIVAFLLCIISLIFFIIGLAGYQANFVQLGLDQLFEAPSHYLGLFVHYATWSFNLGSVPLVTFVSFLLCGHQKRTVALKAIAAVPLIFAVVLIALLIIGRWKHHWFYTEPGYNNPYKVFFKILYFAWKNKHLFQRSAFTYSDHYMPSRLDFAKERYGGPFTTEEVENTKTFLRIALVLLTIRPVFALEVPASYFVYPLFSLHTMHQHERFGNEFCSAERTWKTVFVTSNSLMLMLSMVLLFPIHIWITHFTRFTKLKNWFKRIFLGSILCLLGIATMLVIDLVGHSLNQGGVWNNTQCMFQFYRTNNTVSYPALDLHWSVLIPPNLFLGIGPLILVGTILEFISAQSPQPMKGCLIGVFFAIRGFFQFLNSIMIVPFSLKHPWATGRMIEDPPVTNCGFVYLLFTIVVGLTGFVLFLIAAKKYKYRERDEGMFRQQDVEDVYERYIQQSPMVISSFSDKSEY